MARPAPVPPRPTGAELDILHVLWTRGPSTVRDVHEQLAAGSDLRYTTVLKQMQIMFEKGLVGRDESQRSHVYSAKLKQQATQRQLVRDLLDKAFDGATDQLVLQALNATRVTPDEIAGIRRLLDEWERKRQ
jgi:predicted transcriptional regulator